MSKNRHHPPSPKAIARLLTKQARKIRKDAREGPVDLALLKRALRRSLKALKKAK